ncbi:bromodomain-containing protein 7-like isoform X2 [Acanthaster planci]|uniref:Bromodomain-containing protein 7-like isoform X2 n=1 Tax=Acanthaster planci TaxID=133434 RepID=A0A8B7ZWN6_ACAPL|nr:bromodomain-containing protein 7-like isoform X2 [Acanthaster planci]
MGKKHKKHHKSEKNLPDVPVTRDLRAEPPLKLVLKVGGKLQDAKTGKFDICVSKPEGKSHHATLDDPRDHAPKSESHKKKKKKRKWHDVQNSNSEQEKEGVETEGSQEEQPMETDEPKEDIKQLLSNKIKMLKKQRCPEEESSEKAEDLIEQGSVASERTPRDQEQEVQRQTPSIREKENIEAMKVPLKKVLESLQKTIQRKDVDQFFAWPVNDVIAPGYSSIILHPMDFSTMKKKMDASEYTSIEEYKSDFLLMCENATIYNRPETIYYKAAKRLQAVGLKCMSKEKLSNLKRTFGYHESSDFIKFRTKTSKRLPQIDMDASTEDSSIMDVLDSEDSNILPTVGSGSVADGNEEESAEEIIEQAMQAAKEARDRLSARCPNSKLGFLRRDKTGTTTLAVLNPSLAGAEESKQVNLGMLTGRLTQGSGTLPGFREDKRNKAVPVTYMTHGPFSSYGPQYDSSFANISKEDSDLLYSTYGDETGVQYAQSIREYVEDCDDYVLKLVDNLLNTLTKGQHTKTMAVLQKRGDKESENANRSDGQSTSGSGTSETAGSQDVVKKENKGVSSPIPFDSLRTLSDLGIDVSFLPAFEKLLGSDSYAAAASDSAEIDSKLKSTSELISDLEKTQSARLSQKPPSHLQFIPKPSEQESSIAEKLTQQLLQLTSKIKPSDVVSTEAARAAMGITADIQGDLVDEVQVLDKADSPQPLDVQEHTIV